jgi:Flp pilus assembly protein TadD
LFEGWAHERLGRHDEAARAFRAALAAVPAGQAAALSLAVRLAAAGDRDEAARLSRVALGPGTDPWREYGYGDLRRLPILLSALRREVR